MKKIKISELAYSPADMMLNSELQEKIEMQSRLYYFNQQQTEYYSSKLGKFYIDFYKTITSSQTETLTGEEWSVVMPSVIYIINALFDKMEILKETSKIYQIKNDVDRLTGFFPQYQNDLFEKLLMDKGLNTSLFLVLNNLLNNKDTTEYYNTYSYIEILKIWIIRELVKIRSFFHKKRTKFNQGNKDSIAVLHIHNLWPFLQKLKLKNKKFINIDGEIYNLYSRPKFHSRPLRKLLMLDILSVLQRIRFNEEFEDLKKNPKVNDIIAILIANLLPVSLIEEFRTTKKKVEKIYNKIKPTASLTCGAQVGDFGSMWLYLAKINGLPVVTLQHGSGYNYLTSPQARIFMETGIFPGLYCTWGNHLKINTYIRKITKIIPLGSPYLNSLRIFLNSEKRIKKILFPIDNFYKYQSLIEGIAEPASVNKNINLQINLLKKLIDNFPNIKIVVKDRVGSWDFIRQNLTDEYISHIKVIQSSRRTYEYFEKNMLVFCSTTAGGVFHESLMSGMKFVLYKDLTQEFNEVLGKNIFNSFIELGLAGTDLDSVFQSFKLQIEGRIDYNNSKIKNILANYTKEYCIRNKNLGNELKYYLENL